MLSVPFAFSFNFLFCWLLKISAQYKRAFQSNLLHFDIPSASVKGASRPLSRCSCLYTLRGYKVNIWCIIMFRAVLSSFRSVFLNLFPGIIPRAFGILFWLKFLIVIQNSSFEINYSLVGNVGLFLMNYSLTSAILLANLSSFVFIWQLFRNYLMDFEFHIFLLYLKLKKLGNLCSRCE